MSSTTQPTATTPPPATRKPLVLRCVAGAASALFLLALILTWAAPSFYAARAEEHLAEETASHIEGTGLVDSLVGEQADSLKAKLGGLFGKEEATADAEKTLRRNKDDLAARYVAGRLSGEGEGPFRSDYSEEESTAAAAFGAELETAYEEALANLLGGLRWVFGASLLFFGALFLAAMVKPGAFRASLTVTSILFFVLDIGLILLALLGPWAWVIGLLVSGFFLVVVIAVIGIALTILLDVLAFGGAVLETAGDLLGGLGDLASGG
ncbi:MAG: hypothetical protein RLY93_03050 [Sumerlaeia bacterium]